MKEKGKTCFQELFERNIKWVFFLENKVEVLNLFYAMEHLGGLEKSREIF